MSTLIYVGEYFEPFYLELVYKGDEIKVSFVRQIRAITTCHLHTLTHTHTHTLSVAQLAHHTCVYSTGQSDRQTQQERD